MDTNETSHSLPPAEPDRSTIIRDALVLQGKLVIDGIRDALLIPISFIAALISILQPGDERGRLFYEVVNMGKRSERWINLFGAADRLRVDADATEAGSLDEYLAQVEDRIMSDYRDHEITRSAREAMDSLVERIEAARQKFRETRDQGRS